MQKYYPQIGITFLFIIFIVLSFILKRKKRPKSQKEEELISIRSVKNFVQKGTDNNDFVSYLYAWAQQQKVPKESIEQISQALAESFESIKLSYVYQTGKILILNNVNDTIRTAATQYFEQK
jgi:hypothetical protein